MSTTVFEEVNKEKLKEFYIQLYRYNQSKVDYEIDIERFILKTQFDFASAKGYKNKKGEIDYKSVKSAQIKKISQKLIYISSQEKRDQVLNESKAVLEKTINEVEEGKDISFEFFIGKKLSFIEETILYITNYLNRELNNEYINSIAQKLEKIEFIKEEIKEIKNTTHGILEKKELKILETFVKLGISSYKENKLLELKKEFGIEVKPKSPKDEVTQEEILKLSNILNS